jgi:hypothetical protein
MYQNGRGVAKDERDAVRWYREAWTISAPRTLTARELPRISTRLCAGIGKRQRRVEKAAELSA